MELLPLMTPLLQVESPVYLGGNVQHRNSTPSLTIVQFSSVERASRERISFPASVPSHGLFILL